jgi:RNA polymerase sigma factor (sigma-70 family)
MEPSALWARTISGEWARQLRWSCGSAEQSVIFGLQLSYTNCDGGKGVSDRERFSLIFEAHHGALEAYVRRRVPPSAVADIVSETFLAAWRKLDQIDHQSLPWLYRAAALEIAYCRRNQQRDESLWRRIAASPWPIAEDPADVVLGRDQWALAFGSLSEPDREVLRLVAWEDLTPHEAARVLGCSVVAFRVRLHRARRRLIAQTAETAVQHLEPAPFPEGEIRP